MNGRRGGAWWCAVVAVAAVAGSGRPAAAQGGDGFLFGAPKGAITLRGGLAGANAKGSLFDFVTDTLTLGRRDFQGLGMGLDLTIATAYPRLGVVLGAGYATSSAASEFRNWVDANDQPITQTTQFRRLPLTAGFKGWVLPPGRAIGSLAWVPSRVAPWVGAGVGATWYRFRQQGSFIDHDVDPPVVFDDDYLSEGWGPTAYGAAGIDVSVSPRMAVTAEARYLYAKADVGQDFLGFDRLDLSGLATTVGLTFRF